MKRTLNSRSCRSYAGQTHQHRNLNVSREQICVWRNAWNRSIQSNDHSSTAAKIKRERWWQTAANDNFLHKLKLVLSLKTPYHWTAACTSVIRLHQHNTELKKPSFHLSLFLRMHMQKAGLVGRRLNALHRNKRFHLPQANEWSRTFNWCLHPNEIKNAHALLRFLKGNAHCATKTNVTMQATWRKNANWIKHVPIVAATVKWHKEVLHTLTMESGYNIRSWGKFENCCKHCKTTGSSNYM